LEFETLDANEVNQVLRGEKIVRKAPEQPAPSTTPGNKPEPEGSGGTPAPLPA
jgi:hypothetical protein